MDRLRDGKIQLENNSKDFRQLREEMRSYNRQTVLSVIGSGALMSSAIVYGLGGETPAMLAGAPLVSWVSGTVGFILLILAFKE